MRQTVFLSFVLLKVRRENLIASILEVYLPCYLLVFSVEANEMKPVSEHWQGKGKGRGGK